MSDYNASIEALNSISFSFDGLRKAYIEERNKVIELTIELEKLGAELKKYKKLYGAEAV